MRISITEPKSEPFGHVNSTELDSALDQLGGMMAGSGIEWYLTGGVAIDLNLGRWNRCHNDLDLLVPVELLQGFKEYLEAFGHKIVYRAAMMVVFGKKLSVYRPLTTRDRQRLKAIDFSQPNPLLREIDVCPFERQAGYFMSFDYDSGRFPQVSPFTYTTASGYEVPVVDLAHIKAVKNYRIGKKPTVKDAFDLSLIHK